MRTRIAKASSREHPVSEALGRLRAVFFGTSEFAVPALQTLGQSVKVAGVVTQPDRRAGRGQKMVPTPVKKAALNLGFTVWEPTALKSFEHLHSEHFDIFVLASYGKILPQSVLSLPRLGALNIHPSLLPKYRGATPIQSALRNGDAQTGVSIILMDAGMDTGPLLLQQSAEIRSEDNYGALHDRLARQGAALLLKAIARLAEGSLQAQPQTGEPSYTKPIRKEDLAIHWDWVARQVVDTVRALAPKPAARGNVDGETVKLLQARAVPSSVSSLRPGAVAGTADDGLLIKCGDGLVSIEKVIAPNRAPESGAAYFARIVTSRT